MAAGPAVSNNLPFPNGTGAADDNFAVEATGLLEIPVDGDYQFGFRSDDGASLQIVGQTWSNLTFAVNANSVISGDTLIHNALYRRQSHPRQHPPRGGDLSRPGRVFRERRRGASGSLRRQPAEHQPDLLRGGWRFRRDGSARPDPGRGRAHPGCSADRESLRWSDDPLLDFPLPGASYRVEWSTNHTTWTPLLSGIASQGATTMLIMADTFGSPFLLFRILEED